MTKFQTVPSALSGLEKPNKENDFCPSEWLFPAERFLMLWLSKAKTEKARKAPISISERKQASRLKLKSR
jgi:hypothetical protein